MICHYDTYSLFRCFPFIPGAGYGEEFHIRDERCSLGQGVFKWLASIQPSYLVYRCGDICYLEPYAPSHLACQFEYDQPYVGNPNAHLAFMGSLTDSARAWRHFIVGCIEAHFCMPLKTPNLLISLRFSQWYRPSNSNPSRFNINTSGTKLIFK